MRYLLILFIAMPIIEIGMFIRVGGWLGMWLTLLIVVITAVLGAWMLRQQGASTMIEVQHRLQAGEMPAQQIIEGFLLLVGGGLLVTPGFVTDAMGFACLIPGSRRGLVSLFLTRSKGGTVFMNTGGGSRRANPSHRPAEPSRARVDDAIEGDYREID